MIFLMLMALNHVLAFSQAKMIVESDTLYKAPESIAYDSLRGVLYVSNFSGVGADGKPRTDNTISKIGLNGELLKTDYIGGLSMPTGICIYNRDLYIVERQGVVIFDLDKEEIRQRIPIETKDFLNDITLDPAGNIFVTVSGTSKILCIDENGPTVWLEDEGIHNPNGILYHKGRLLVGTTGDGCLKMIKPETREISLIAYIGEQIVDGIRPCGSGYLVSLFEGNLFWVSLEGKVIELINTREEGVYLADFEYIESKGLLFVPCLWNNMIRIYKLEEME